MKEAIIAGVTAVLTAIITNVLFALIGFHYSFWEDGFDLLLFVIDAGVYFVIFLLIFIVLKKLFIAGKEV